MNRTHGLSVHSNEGIPEYATFDLLAAIRGVGTSYQVGTDHEMTSGRDLVSLECSADEMIQNGQSQMSFRDGAPKTGSLELWEVQSRSSMLRSGAVWFFTSSNPKLTFGGMEGEPKREMYDLLHYHSNVPVEYIVQRMVHYPIEVSVFHIRYPDQQKGVITGFLHKIPLQVTGDGKHTLEELILLHPKAAKRTGELHSKHKEKWRSIIPAGERYILSYAANHNRGAHFVDLKEYIN
ncbi:MAG: hypothetical protein EOO38_24320, partial [Cytophagaceae bacterium]